MLQMYRILPVLMIACAIAGCAGPDPTDAVERVSSISGSAAIAAADRLEQWSQWLDDPGQPGVDYDPHRITVIYRDGATAPRGTSTAVPAAGLCAADQPNSIVRVNPGYEALTDAIAAGYGIPITRQIYWRGVNVAGFSVPDGMDGDELLAAIRSDYADEVEFAAYSMLYHAAETMPNDPDYTKSNADSYGALWTLHRIGCSAAWDYTTGDPAVRVAVVDTGVRVTHEELSQRVLDPATDFPDMPIGTYLDVVNNDNTMEDTHHHGTVIAGQIAAEGNNHRTIVGAAYGCEVIPIKISNDGVANDMDIITGCTLAVELGAKVINLSFGDTHNNPAMEQMVNDIWAAGALFVAASGNDGATTFHYPADYDRAVSVGATDIDDARTEFSNYGPGVDIAAPGQGIKSCWYTGDSEYSEWTRTGGTSFACPLVAAAAALLWSYDPNLTNQEVRNLLMENTAPVIGFSNPAAGRLDIAAALDGITPLSLRIEKPLRLVYNGTIQLVPEVSGTPEKVEYYFNGDLIETRTAEPWIFEINTAAVMQFGIAGIEVVATLGLAEASASIGILVDNTNGIYPVTEDFEEAGNMFVYQDLKHHSEILLKAVKDIPGPGQYWSTAGVEAAGAGGWMPEVGDVYDGSRGRYCGTGTRAYDLHELDALVSRRIDLEGVVAPTLVFHHRYNLDDGGDIGDKAWVYVTNDGGLTFTPAALRDGGPASFAGMTTEWETVEVDLSDFAEQVIHLAFVLETDNSQMVTAAPDGLGWWIDKIAVGTGYQESFPSIGGVNIAADTFIGAVPGVASLPVSLLNPQDISAATFTLDFAPVGEVDSYDLVLEDDVPVFEAVFNLPLDLTNRELVLHVSTLSVEGLDGPNVSVPLYLFNLAGDVNLDGVVNEDDTAALAAGLGAVPGDAAYSVFSDDNADGVIDEQDAGVIGYNYGESL